MNLLINVIALSLGLALGLYLTQGLAAQDEMPRVGAQAAPATDPGTTVVGERESPIGLYITPWLDSTAERDIDRPARLLEERIEMLDETVFLRQVDYYDALNKARERKNAETPR